MRRTIDLIILLIVLVAGGFALQYRIAITDELLALRYHPSSDIVALADAAGMNAEGKKLFYRFSPQIVDQQTLDNVCSVEKLGCTEGQSIYILQASNAAEQNRNIVTAAHEMLHVAYSRLSASDKQTVKTLTDAELAKPASLKIAEALDTYPLADRDNEAHSFIGSQSASISSDLSRYYSRYFNDRAKSTAAYAASPEN